MRSIGLGAMNLHGYLAKIESCMRVNRQETSQIPFYDG